MGHRSERTDPPADPLNVSAAKNSAFVLIDLSSFTPQAPRHLGTGPRSRDCNTSLTSRRAMRPIAESHNVA
jgi:hypothetical protein